MGRGRRGKKKDTNSTDAVGLVVRERIETSGPWEELPNCWNCLVKYIVVYLGGGDFGVECPKARPPKKVVVPSKVAKECDGKNPKYYPKR